MACRISVAVLGEPLVRAVRARLSEGAQSHSETDMSAAYLTSVPKAPR
jgi:hypothetical protein